MKKRLPHSGKLEWIGIRPVKNSPLTAVDRVEVNTDNGLEGDHYQARSGSRMVTLIQAEHIEAVATFMKKESVAPGLLRRNLVVSGINLQAFKDQQLRIGPDVILEMTAQCHPCSKMERNLGHGGYNAMRGHGGICTRVIQGGRICVGDVIKGLIG